MSPKRQKNKTVRTISRNKAGTEGTLPKKKPPVYELGLSDDVKYTCTGNFEQDFTNLCSRIKSMAYVPPVVQRVSMARPAKEPTPKEEPVTTTAVKSGRISKTKRQSSFETAESPKSDRGRVAVYEEAFAEPPRSEMEAEPEPYTTFKVKDSLQFFKPTVQVEVSTSPSDSGPVTEVYVRGWRVDAAMMGVLSECLPVVGQLRLLHLWNTGLTPLTAATLLSFLPLCSKLTSLTLDANPLGAADLSPMLDESSRLTDLSLRFCGLGDVNGLQIGRQLGTTARRNATLINLNLSNNRIGDEGARDIAQGLKTNRTLLTLNLSSNAIGNDGVTALAETLSQFPLDKEQMLERRIQEKDIVVKQPPPLPLQSLERSSEKNVQVPPNKEQAARGLKAKLQQAVIDVMKGRLVSPEGKARGANKAKEQKEKEVEKKRKRKITGQTNVSRKVTEAPRSPPEQETAILPLNEVGHVYEGLFWILGNRSLISLNLARNRIGEAGLRRLLDMVQFQSMPVHNQQQTSIGLRRLVLDRNCVAMGSQVLQLIRHAMTTRDPLYKMPVVQLHRMNVPPCAMPPVSV